MANDKDQQDFSQQNVPFSDSDSDSNYSYNEAEDEAFCRAFGQCNDGDNLSSSENLKHDDLEANFLAFSKALESPTMKKLHDDIFAQSISIPIWIWTSTFVCVVLSESGSRTTVLVFVSKKY